MGLCISVDDPDAQRMNNTIEREGLQQFQADQLKVKLLLLGAGESGKSTIFKQLKLLYGEGFSEQDVQRYSKYIRLNVMETMQDLVELTVSENQWQYLQAVDAFNVFRQYGDAKPHEDDFSYLVEHIRALWADPVIQELWGRRSEFQLINTAEYFLGRLDEIADGGYRPTQEDILRARVRTTGIVEQHFAVEGNEFVLLDVGGQKNERRKWVHCFADVTAVIFVAALSEYDQAMFEEETTNRMVDALELFREQINSQWFESKDIILFLNKRDLFEEKVVKVSIPDMPEWQEDYDGQPYDYNDGVRYFVSKFMRLNENTERKVFTQVTCATDTGNIRFVFNACKQSVLDDNLKQILE